MTAGHIRSAPALTLALAIGGCSGLSPQAAKVAVYQAPLDAPAAAKGMPAGCTEVATQPLTYLSEFAMTGVDDPYRVERNAAAAQGANVLLVLSSQIVPRQCFNCPAASPITDCPPCEGAWFDVVFASYACSPEGLAALPSTVRP